MPNSDITATTAATDGHWRVESSVRFINRPSRDVGSYATRRHDVEFTGGTCQRDPFVVRRNLLVARQHQQTDQHAPAHQSGPRPERFQLPVRA
jgi:hypothetical protein